MVRLVGAVNELRAALSTTASGSTLAGLESRVAANERGLASQTQSLQTEASQREAGDAVLRVESDGGRFRLVAAG